MTDFVENLRDEMTSKGDLNFKETKNYFDKVFNYSDFLKQPLTLGMFVPTDENGNVFNEPNSTNWQNFTESGKYRDIKFQEAKEKVLFKDANVKPVEDYYIVKIGKREVWISWTHRTIEDVQHINRAYEMDFELTESALKNFS